MVWNDFNKFPWSVPLGRVLRIPVRLHITFFIMWIAQTLGAIVYGFWSIMLALIMLGPILLFTILVHELGHCMAARSIGGTAESILLWPLGGLAYIGYNTTHAKAIWVAVAGPLTHIPMVAIWVGLLFPAYHASMGSWHITLEFPPVDSRHFGHALITWAIVMNISLFLFNLLVPAYPLDGGRIMVHTLMWMGVSMRRTAIITVAIATPIAVGLIVFGIVVFQMVTILVAVFILYSNFQLFLAIRRDKLAEHPLFARASAANAGAATGTTGGGFAPNPNAPGPAPGPAPGALPGMGYQGYSSPTPGKAAGHAPRKPDSGSGPAATKQAGSAFSVGNVI